MGGAAAGLAILAACGDDDVDERRASAQWRRQPCTRRQHRVDADGRCRLERCRRQRHGLGVATGDYSRVINKSSGSLTCTHGVTTTTPTSSAPSPRRSSASRCRSSYYTSNEDLITKLQASKGTSGFDIVVPTGPYIPQMIQNGLLEKFDKSKLPNMVNVDPLYLGQAWDPTNDYSVCKDWGSTGWIYDKTKIKTEIKTWNDFIAVCQGEGSKNCSMLDTPGQHRRACTSGRTASTGPRRRPTTSTPPRSSSSTSSRRTSRRSTATRPTRSPRAHTPCR